MQPEPQAVKAKNPYAQQIGSKGGLTRTANQTPEQRSKLARLAAFARHHPEQFQQRKERAEEIALMVEQMLNVKHLPLI